MCWAELSRQHRAAKRAQAGYWWSLVPALLVTVLFAPKTVRAEEALFHLEYSAPVGCPTRDDLLLELGERTQRVRLAAPGEPAPGYTVSIEPATTGVWVLVEEQQWDGTLSRRAVPARDCPEATAAAALILAVLLDPAANAGSLGSASDASRKDEAAAARAANGPQLGRRVPTDARASAKPPRRTPRSIVQRAVIQRPIVRRSVIRRAVVQPGLGAEAGWVQTSLPETPLGYGGFVEVSVDTTSAFAPSLRLALLGTGRGDSGKTDRGRVETRLIAERATACLLRWPARGLLDLRACALFEFGRLHGKGRDSLQEQDVVAPWWAAGGALRVELWPATFSSLDLTLGLVLPLRRDRFVFGPKPVQVGYEVQAAGVTFMVDVALFPWR
jgi:hypothetical protein